SVSASPGGDDGRPRRRPPCPAPTWTPGLRWPATGRQPRRSRWRSVPSVAASGLRPSLTLLGRCVGGGLDCCIGGHVGRFVDTGTLDDAVLRRLAALTVLVGLVVDTALHR